MASQTYTWKARLKTWVPRGPMYFRMFCKDTSVSCSAREGFGNAISLMTLTTQTLS